MVGRPVIVADVEVGRAIIVQIPESGGQSPVQRRVGQRFPSLVEEGAVGERDGAEVGASVVEIKNIRLAELQESAVLKPNSVAQLGRHRRLLVNEHHGNARSIPDVIGPVVANVKVESAVAVDVRQRQGFSGIRAGGGGLRCGIDEMAAQLTLRLFPSAEWLGRRRQPRVDAEIVEEAIGGQPVDIAAIPLLGIFIFAREHSDLRHRERLDLRGDGVLREDEWLLERRNFGHGAASLGGGIWSGRGLRRGLLSARRPRSGEHGGKISSGHNQPLGAGPVESRKTNSGSITIS